MTDACNPGECFIFYDVASRAFTESDAGRLWRAKLSLENTLALLAELSPSTRERFPLLPTKGCPDDSVTLSLGSMERQLAAHVALVERAQEKSPTHSSVDWLCLACLCDVYSKHTGAPGVSLSGPFIRYVRDAYAQQRRDCPSAETIRRVVRAWRQRGKN